jgi:hypothetical protein
MEELPDQGMESSIIPIYKKKDKAGCIIISVECHCYQLQTKSYQYPSLKLNSIYRW